VLEGRTDLELVEDFKSSVDGDFRPFEELVGRYQSRVMANCRHLSGAPAQAEDLAQEVFLKAYFGLAKFESRSEFSTWIYRIKINHCLTFREKQKGRVHQSMDSQGAGQSPEELVEDVSARGAVEAVVERQAIRKVLDEMPESLRIPLVLRDADGLSYDEISDQLQIGLSAVKMRIKRGREEFRRLYDAVS